MPDLNTFQFARNPSFIIVQWLAVLDRPAMVSVHSSAPVLPLEKAHPIIDKASSSHSSLQAFHRPDTIDTQRWVRCHLWTQACGKSIEAHLGEFVGIWEGEIVTNFSVPVLILQGNSWLIQGSGYWPCLGGNLHAWMFSHASEGCLFKAWAMVHVIDNTWNWFWPFYQTFEGVVSLCSYSSKDHQCSWETFCFYIITRFDGLANFCWL